MLRINLSLYDSLAVHLIVGLSVDFLTHIVSIVGQIRVSVVRCHTGKTLEEHRALEMKEKRKEILSHPFQFVLGA